MTVFSVLKRKTAAFLNIFYTFYDNVIRTLVPVLFTDVFTRTNEAFVMLPPDCDRTVVRGILHRNTNNEFIIPIIQRDPSCQWVRAFKAQNTSQ